MGNATTALITCALHTAPRLLHVLCVIKHERYLVVKSWDIRVPYKPCGLYRELYEILHFFTTLLMLH